MRTQDVKTTSEPLEKAEGDSTLSRPDIASAERGSEKAKEPDNAFKAEIKQYEPGMRGWFKQNLDWLRQQGEITRLTFSQLVSETAGWIIAAGGTALLTRLQDAKHAGVSGFMQKLANPLERAVSRPTIFKGVDYLASHLPILGKTLAGNNKHWGDLSRNDQITMASKQLVTVGGANAAAFFVNSGVQWYMDNKLGVQQDSLKETMGLKLLTDEMPKVITFLLCNTALKKPTEWMQTSLKNMLGKDSHTVSNVVDTIVLLGPAEVAGTISNIAALHYNRKRKMTDKVRQEQEQSASAVLAR